jgi:hypothetical protein
MSTPNQSTTPAPAYPEPTPADQDAMFASVLWFRDQREAGAFGEYEGMYVAILGEKIIDADPDPDELGRRLDLHDGALTPNRVVLQYVHRPEDWNWK